MLAEIDRNATVSRLAAGKRVWREQGKRVDGRHPFGQHPMREYDWERAVVERIRQMHADGVSMYRIARTLSAEGVRTRYGKEFQIVTVMNILERVTRHTD